MKKIFYSLTFILALFLWTGVRADDIKWTQVYEDTLGRPLYTGGITNSAPTFVDIDGDGDIDMFVGGYVDMVAGVGVEKIIFYENIGDSTRAKWRFITDYYDSIACDNWSCPSITFADIDADGDYDMFLGKRNRVAFYRNDGDAHQPLWTWITNNYVNLGHPDRIWSCSPFFADIDANGTLDLFVGFHGSLLHTGIHFYRNDGTPQEASWTLVTTYYHSMDGEKPFLVDIDSDGDLDFFYGVWTALYFYRNDGTPQEPSWTMVTDQYNDIGGDPVGDREISPAFTDIDGDGDYDMFVGNEEGQVFFYRNDGTDTIPDWSFVTPNYLAIDVGYDSFPAFVDIDGDKDLDMFISEDPWLSGAPGDPRTRIWFYRNDGDSTFPIWTLVTTDYDSLHHPCPAFVDIDSDGDYDLFVGVWRGGSYPPIRIWYYRNDGTPHSAMWNLVDTMVVGIEAYYYVVPAFVDIDNDGDYDMFVGKYRIIDPESTFFSFIRNDGNPTNPVWTFVTDDYFHICHGHPAFCDIDTDGDYDLFIGPTGLIGGLGMYENRGSPDSTNFVFSIYPYDSLYFPGDCLPSPAFVDIDGDGDKDLFLGGRNGGLVFYRNDGFGGIREIGDGVGLPTRVKLKQNYPNPFNSSTLIRYHLPAVSGQRSAVRPHRTTLKIYNILGQEVKVLVNNKKQKGGYYEVTWDGKDRNGEAVASGVYFCRLEVKGNRIKVVRTKKMIILR